MKGLKPPTVMMSKLHRIPVLVLSVGAALVFLLSGCGSSSSIKSSDDERVNTALETAEKMIGTPYCWAGSTPDCFDCSGLVNYSFAKCGVQLPRTTRELFRTGESIDLDAVQPGDLVFFNTNGKSVSHVGMAIGNMSFIHASTSKGVMISAINDRYWGPRYLGARRVLD